MPYALSQAGSFQPVADGGDAMALAKRVSLFVFLMVCFGVMTSAPSTASDLTDALKSRDVAQVRSLLAAGADVNEKVRGDYPINVAALFGPAEMVSLLLDAGANLEEQGRDGLHPLHNAVAGGRAEIVALLIGKGAAVNSRDKQGRTPLLSFAASAGSAMDIPKLLLAGGADPDIAETVDQLRPLDFAAINGNVELARLLLSTGVDVNHRQAGSWGETAIMHAIFHDRLDVVRLLIAQGADVNLANKQGQGLMHYATGKPEMTRLLIEAGAK
jgi:uncharacterized protein